MPHKSRHKSKTYGCPHCGSTEGFAEANLMEATAYVSTFDGHGQPNYAGESDIDWDSQRLDPSKEKPYQCEACVKSFSKPSLVTGRQRKKAA
jgi:DNA-directed RNA polymerase subunit RPC12/RpoP